MSISSSVEPCVPARDRRNDRRRLAYVVAWSAWWLLALAAAHAGWLHQLPVALGVATVHAGLGIGMILAYRRFLVEADELRRKIELDAMAVGVGVAVVGGFTASLLEAAGVISSSTVVEVLAMPFLAYVVVLARGMRHYA